MIIRNASRWLSCYIVLNLELCHPKKNITSFVTFYHSIHIYFGENCFLKIGTCQLSSYLTWKCTLFGFIISNLRSRDCMQSTINECTVMANTLPAEKDEAPDGQRHYRPFIADWDILTFKKVRAIGYSNTSDKRS